MEIANASLTMLIKSSNPNEKVGDHKDLVYYYQRRTCHTLERDLVTLDT